MPNDDLSINQALRALTSSAHQAGDTTLVTGRIGALRVPWLLSAAHRIVRHAAHLEWNRSGGLFVHIRGGATYQFVTGNPATVPDPGPTTTTRPQLHTVPADHAATA